MRLRRKITNGSNEIIAVLGLDNKMRLPNGTKAEISKDLMGNVELDLILGPNPVDQMEPGDTIYGQMQQGALAKAGEIIPQIQQMMNSGRITQEQYNQAVQMAQQLQRMLPPSVHR